MHHGLWDYDLPAAPNLIDVRVNGTPVKAVAQVTKQGFVYVFDRVTGRSIWPIEERPVPQSTVPGERSSRTALPDETRAVRPAVSESDVVGFTPGVAQAEHAGHSGQVQLRSTVHTAFDRKPTIQMPGWAERASWAGAACDPETGMMYLPSITSPLAITMVNRPSRSPAPYVGAPALMETLQECLSGSRPTGASPPLISTRAITGGWYRWATLAKAIRIKAA